MYEILDDEKYYRLDHDLVGLDSKRQSPARWPARVTSPVYLAETNRTEKQCHPRWPPDNLRMKPERTSGIHLPQWSIQCLDRFKKSERYLSLRDSVLDHGRVAPDPTIPDNLPDPAVSYQSTFVLVRKSGCE
jgi:hypothetical protein